MISPRPKLSALYWMIAVLLVASLACSLPGLGPDGVIPTLNPVIPPTATPPPPSLPPAVVESSPPPGAELPLDSDVTLYFNQPMDQASVEAALNTGSTIGGKLTWVGETTLVFQPANPLPPESDLVLAINQTAKARNGLAMLRPVELRYRTAGFLRSAQLLPEPGAVDVDPSSAVLLTFNRPVVALGAEPAGLPAGFIIEPAAPGKGQWINTSTYIFYPEPALNGGQTYSVRINPDLRSTDGGPLNEIPGWSFSTALPRLVAATPVESGQGVALDMPVQLEFNQRMDPVSTAAAFSLLNPDGQPVAGINGWNADFSTFVFTPTSLLERSAVYTARLDGSAMSAGGTALGGQFSASWQTTGGLTILAQSLPYNGLLPIYSNITLDFSAPLPTDGFEKSIQFNPIVKNLGFYFEPESNRLYISGNFEPAVSYVMTVASTLQDRWGGQLNAPFELAFTTGNLYPSLVYPAGGGTFFLRPQDTSFEVQSVNIFEAPAAFGTISLGDYLRMLAPSGYELMVSYQAPDARRWTASLNTQINLPEMSRIDIAPDSGVLTPGMYWLRLDPPETTGAQPVFMVISNVQLTFKVSANDVLVWAVDLRNQAPVPGAPVVIYAEDGAPMATGFTDAEGVFKASIPPQTDPYRTYTAVLAQPGADAFSLATSAWNQGISAYDFNLPVSRATESEFIYLYTDRPIYRPGDTVYFRAVARQALNGRYTLPAGLPSLPVKITDSQGGQVAVMDLPLTAFGSAHSEYKLFAGAVPGYYQIQAGSALLSFQVADYRKPEINVTTAFAASDVIFGQRLQAEINARYFFDAPASAVKLHWALYAQSDPFRLSSYQIGPQDDRWLQAWVYPSGRSLYGALLAEGDVQTDQNGGARLDLPTDAKPDLVNPAYRQEYKLEVTLTDETGLPVSTRASAWVHPAALYIGVQADQWSGKAGQAGGFTITALDFAGQPSGAHALHADYRRVEWERQDPPAGDPMGQPTFIAHYTPKGSADFATSAAGTARLEFTPDEPGIFQLSISGEKALTEILVWVNGPGEIAWPEIPNQRLEITPNKQNYKPGETANLFIPNPFPTPVVGLLTIERGIVMRHQVFNLPVGGAEIAVPLGTEDSPNIFAAVTILSASGEKGLPDFRQGYLNLAVDPASQLIQVDLSVSPERAGPGEEVQITLKARDEAGSPVQAEFSLSVVDKAVLTLADPNSMPIEPAFYGQQGLAVRTGVSLAAYIYRSVFTPGGLGGGGGDMPAPVVRDDFPDTAFWEAELLTDANGQAQVSLTLPDNLTTWQVEARGLTASGLVGQALVEIISSKDLLVRPVVPRFMVAGDHLQLGAVVQNNTATALPVTVNLQAGGLKLDADQSAAQTVDVPAFGRTRLNWWGIVQDVASADLLFSAHAGDLVDMVRPASGRIPVLHYAAAQAFATSGVLEGAGLQLELVSLPASYPAAANPTDELRLELAPSLAAAMIGSLGARSAGSAFCTEQVVSTFLPNLETYRLLEGLGFQATETQADLERNIRTGLQDVLNTQQADGGWAWWAENPSDSYITAYALFALLHAQDAGMNVPSDSITRAGDYLNAALVAPEALNEGWQLDRLAFINYVLAEAGLPNASGLSGLFSLRARLSPWARAVLALGFDASTPGSQESLTLFSDLQAEAQRSALGASWQDTSLSRQNMHGEISATGVVAFALAQHDPAAPLLTDAVRFLMANRRAARTWSSTFSASWALLAINSFIKGTGDLNASFDFSASLNGEALLSGQAGGDTRLTPVRTALPATRLYPGAPNALAIERGEGSGRLYYSAVLQVSQPVLDIQPLSAGFTVNRQYALKTAECPAAGCPPVLQAQAGQAITVQLNLIVPKDAYHVRLEDYIPAGAEVLDMSLKTTQLGQAESQTVQAQPFNPRQPFLRGWAWWLFNRPEVYADHIAWTATHLPAGTYQVTYTLNLLQAGEFQVLPARAYQMYFPDVQGNSAGSVFAILP